MASSKQEYLKRYVTEAETSKKKKKKRRKAKTSNGALTIVDGDPVWQKDVKEVSSESESDQEDAPLVIKDVEFKRMQRLEALRMRPFFATAEDGSGWISVNEDRNQGLDVEVPQEQEAKGCESPDLSPPRKKHAQGLSPSSADSGHNDAGSPERREKEIRKSRHDTPESDLSPPRRHNEHHSVDLSPPRRGKESKKGHHHTLHTEDDSVSHRSPPKAGKAQDLSPPRRRQTSSRGDHSNDKDLSPPRRRLASGDHSNDQDLSPPRKRPASSRMDDSSNDQDLSSRRRQASSRMGDHSKDQDLSPPRRRQTSSKMGDHSKDDIDLFPKRRCNRDAFDSRDHQKYKKREAMADGTATGLQSGRQLAKETDKKKQNDSKRLTELEMSISGRHATTVYRDKHGKRLEGVDEILKLQQAEEPEKEEKPLEWGKGLVQKREAEARHAELEAEKIKPFARTRDDPDLDKSLKEKVRWGDPMAHLVKKKIGEPVLMDLGASEQMKDSGFIVPQAIPKHSWLMRGITPPANRYNIKPGRHWDGVDRSTGYERDMYKKQNEKKAEQVEAYLWSVADM